MMSLDFSIIIPVYNRPEEIDELLESIVQQNFTNSFEVIIVEDGSNKDAKDIVEKFQPLLDIKYFYKENTGAGLSRNFGMEKASGNYFIILDSDVVLPKSYLQNVYDGLSTRYTDAFGGPDAAAANFTVLQKAINYAMTSFLTTGGIRGKKNGIGKFQPRSFNLGISKKAFMLTKGFLNLKAGEDIDLTFRLWQNNLETQLVTEAFVYHKRRGSLQKFFKQTFAFGTARPLLNKKYPKSAKITYWFPSLFVLFFLSSFIVTAFTRNVWGLFPLFVYLLAILVHSTIVNKSFMVGLWTPCAVIVQFFAYGIGFLKSILDIRLSK